MYRIRNHPAAGNLVFDTKAPFDSTATSVALEDTDFETDQERDQMLFMYKTFASLRSNERGASMVEYALLLVLIAIIAFAAVRLAGQSVSSAFSTVANGFTNPN